MTGERVARWLRVSSDQQDVSSQRRSLDGHCAAHFYVTARTFELPDTSAYKGRQAAALAEALADVRAGLYSRVVAVSSSRFERRGIKVGIGYLIALDDAGGRLEAADNPLFGDLSGAGGWHVTLAACGADHDYSVNISNAVRRGNADVDARGGYRGGRLPLGYASACTECGTLQRGERRCVHRRSKAVVPDPELAPVVREAFELIAGGAPVPAVVAWLASAHGVRRTSSSLLGVIRNPVYWTGAYKVAGHDGVTRVTMTAPLVSHQLWQAANGDLAARLHTGPRAPRMPRKDDFSAALFCGRCGGVAYRSTGGRSNGDRAARRRVYMCRPCHVYDWDADAADAQVRALMGGDAAPEVAMVTVPGTDHAAEAEAVARALRDLPARELPEHEEDAERARLRGLRRRLKELPVTAATREPRFTGRTRAQAWEAMSHPERIALLRAGEFQLRLYGRGTAVRVARVWLDDELFPDNG